MYGGFNAIIAACLVPQIPLKSSGQRLISAVRMSAGRGPAGITNRATADSRSTIAPILLIARHFTSRILSIFRFLHQQTSTHSAFCAIPATTRRAAIQRISWLARMLRICATKWREGDYQIFLAIKGRAVSCRRKTCSGLNSYSALVARIARRLHCFTMSVAPPLRALCQGGTTLRCDLSGGH